MSSFNKVYLLGNLTRDPESRTLPSGTVLASFGLAVNRSNTKADGESVEETTFVDIDAFGRSAENILKYSKKG
jgi:single-strand DNA-binding protein